MTDHELTKLFYSLVAPSHPNEWEISDIVELLRELQNDSRDELLKYVPAIWPISHSLCYSYIQHGSQQIKIIPKSLLAEWVRQILFHYETAGLRSAESFMANAQHEFINRHRETSSITFAEISKSMNHYLHGISNSNVSLVESNAHWTDTKNIYLPSTLELFDNKEENRLFYKFIITYQWVLIHLGCFKILDQHKELAQKIENSTTLKALYTALYFSKICHYLKNELPGLWKRSLPLITRQIGTARKTSENSLDDFIASFLSDHLFNHNEINNRENRITYNEIHSFLLSQPQILEDCLINSSLSFLLGNLQPKQATETMQLEREKQKDTFIKMLATVLPDPERSESSSSENSTADSDGAKTIIQQLTERVESNDTVPNTIQIDNEQVILPQELIDQAKEIINDMGSIPSGYVQAAVGIAGNALLKGSAESDKLEGGSRSASDLMYDEWDCRRQGYRKDWCTVIVEDLPLVQTDFIKKTLAKHSGLRKQLKKQFEAMMTTHQFVKRQRDGDQLDLDAITDALGAKAAGKPVTDRLFSRLQRNTRNISTLFLVDMSYSTSGWINTFIKEALVLLCEAMEKVGDQYGIYGFSGMRRSRCKLYPVKKLEDVYNDEIQHRLACMTPKDYTRMAPAIRHLTKLLENNDSATRLIIVLSDGKPEDYDAYNGEYAIEDTKKALLEARGVGIIPFCITIDKEAHDYLSHMFGQNNYTFINKIERLPTRIPQIYRSLTQ